MDNHRLLRSTVIGIAAGLAASWIMDRFQAAISAASPDDGDEDKPATVKTADAVSNTVADKPVPGEYEAEAGSAVHYGFGAFLGGLYGALGETLPRVRAGFGTAYGAAVAIVADEMLVPTAGLAPPPQDVPMQTHAYGLASHLVFGLALEGSRRLIETAIVPDRSEEQG
jgi:uncharacterized membrane protein YagU involved in acid resistance